MKSVEPTRSTFMPSHSVSLARCAVYGYTARASIHWLPNFDSPARDFNSTAGLVFSFGCSKQGAGRAAAASKQQARGRNNQGAGRAAATTKELAARPPQRVRELAARLQRRLRRQQACGAGREAAAACAAEGACGPLCGRGAGGSRRAGPGEWPRRRRQEQASGAGSSSRRARGRRHTVLYFTDRWTP